MKLDRLVLVLGAAALAACAAAPAPRAETTLTSAASALDASAGSGTSVKSSKVQRAEPSELAPKDEEGDERREPSRRTGFGSGWK